MKSLDIEDIREYSRRESERRATNGNIVAYACGIPSEPRYVNDKIEIELIEFKKEIEERFAKSKMNQTFVMPLIEE
jgi:hypothetical protein